MGDPGDVSIRVAVLPHSGSCADRDTQDVAGLMMQWQFEAGGDVTHGVWAAQSGAPDTIRVSSVTLSPMKCGHLLTNHSSPITTRPAFGLADPRLPPPNSLPLDPAGPASHPPFRAGSHSMGTPGCYTWKSRKGNCHNPVRTFYKKTALLRSNKETPEDTSSRPLL